MSAVVLRSMSSRVIVSRLGKEVEEDSEGTEVEGVCVTDSVEVAVGAVDACRIAGMEAIFVGDVVRQLVVVREDRELGLDRGCIRLVAEESWAGVSVRSSSAAVRLTFLHCA